MNLKIRKNTEYGIWIIIFVGVLIRLINIQMPLLEGVTTRQIYNAMVTKYFYEHGLNFFYPFMEIRGSDLYVQTIDAPLIPFIGAVLYHVTGGAYTEILRLISVISTAFAALLLYLLIKLISDKRKAIVAVFVFIFSPVNIFVGKSALHEMPLIICTIGAINYFLLWIKKEKFIYSLLGNLFFITAVLIKKTNFYLLLPLGYILLTRWGLRAVKKNWMLFVSLAVILAWQLWEWYLRIIYPDPRWIHFNLKYNLERIFLCYTAPDFYKKIYTDILNYALTPIGLAFCLLGFILKPQNNYIKILYVWLGAVFFFYIIMPEQLWAHAYYHIHYLPIASFFIASGFTFMIDKICDANISAFNKKRSLIIYFAIFFLVFSLRYSISFYKIPDTKKYVLSTAKHVRNIVAKDELVIAAQDNPVGLLYYSQRKGWPINFSYDHKSSVSELENLRSKGAQFLASAMKTELKENTYFWNYLKSNYKTIFEDENCIIFSLKR